MIVALCVLPDTKKRATTCTVAWILAKKTLTVKSCDMDKDVTSSKVPSEWCSQLERRQEMVALHGRAVERHTRGGQGGGHDGGGGGYRRGK